MNPRRIVIRCACCGRSIHARDVFRQPDGVLMCGNCDGREQPGCPNCDRRTR